MQVVDNEEDYQTETIKVEHWNYLFGAAQAGLVLLGYKVWDWYPSWIDKTYDDRVIELTASSRVRDIEWARGTEEMR